MQVEIIESQTCVDHIHMQVSISPYMSVAQFLGTLKGKNALMFFRRHAYLKHHFGSKDFLTSEYFVDTVGKKTISKNFI